MANKAIFQSSFYFSYPVKSAAGAVITITDSFTGEPAELWTGLDGAAEKANPSKIPDTAFFKAGLNPGQYDIVVSDGFQRIDLLNFPVGEDGQGIANTSNYDPEDYTIVLDDSDGNFKKTSMMTLQAFNPSAPDPYFNNVELLMHFDNNLDDSSKNDYTVGIQAGYSGFVGGKFGSGLEIKSEFGDEDVFALEADAQINIENGDFTIECFIINLGEFSSNIFGAIAQNLDELGHGWRFRIGGSTTLEFEIEESGRSVSSDTSILASQEWTHVAATREGNVLRLFVAGEKVGEEEITGEFTQPAVESTEPILIGERWGDFNNKVIDELRITKGVCRYTDNFMPPLFRFPDS